MHIIVTGYSDKKIDPKHRFAEIRFVVKNDANDNLNDDSGNTNKMVESMMMLLTKFYPDIIQKYGLDHNTHFEKKSAKGDAALRFSIKGEQNINDFLNEDLWTDPNSDWQKWLSTKKFKDSNGQFILDQNGQKKVFPILFSFNAQDVKDQIDNSASFDEYYAAEKGMKDYVASLFQKLDQQHVKDFLKNFCGHIKMIQPQQGSENGWEYVQLSTKNSIMVLAQYQKVGITPKFVCNQRDWARFFNRRLIQGATGAVIEVPYRNKRLDTDEYRNKTGSDYYQDMGAGGALAFKANSIGNNQNDDTHEFIPGWVYDESQTELIPGLPDLFNDPNQQRRVTNLGNDNTLAFAKQTQPTQAQINTSISQGTTSPFETNSGVIPQCLENIAKMIQLKRFINKNGVSKYETVKPILADAMKNPNVQSMDKVINELANCELYQIENTKVRSKKAEYRKIIKDCVMLCCGFGEAQDLAQFARQVLQNNPQDTYKVWEHINNIVNIINASKILKENMEKLNEDIAKNISYDEFVKLMGLDNDSVEKQQMQIQENIKKVNTDFNNILNRLNNVPR